MKKIYMIIALLAIAFKVLAQDCGQLRELAINRIQNHSQQMWMNANESEVIRALKEETIFFAYYDDNNFFMSLSADDCNKVISNLSAKGFHFRVIRCNASSESNSGSTYSNNSTNTASQRIDNTTINSKKDISEGQAPKEAVRKANVLQQRQSNYDVKAHLTGTTTMDPDLVVGVRNLYKGEIMHGYGTDPNVAGAKQGELHSQENNANNAETGNNSIPQTESNSTNAPNNNSPQWGDMSPYFQKARQDNQQQNEKNSNPSVDANKNNIGDAVNNSASGSNVPVETATSANGGRYASSSRNTTANNKTDNSVGNTSGINSSVETATSANQNTVSVAPLPHFNIPQNTDSNKGDARATLGGLLKHPSQFSTMGDGVTRESLPVPELSVNPQPQNNSVSPVKQKSPDNYLQSKVPPTIPANGSNSNLNKSLGDGKN